MTRFSPFRMGAAVMLAASVSLAAAPLAIAGARGGFGPPSAKHMAEHAHMLMGVVLDEVEADDAQRASIQTLVVGGAAEMLALRDAGRDTRDALHDAVANGADAATIEALRVEAMEHADAGSKMVLDRVLAVRAILTPEQWAEAVELVDERGFRGAGGHHGRGDGGERGRHGDGDRGERGGGDGDGERGHRGGHHGR